MKLNKNVLMLSEVALGLGKLKDEVVFVGGAVTSLYVDDPGAPPVTVSDDVDCVVEVAGDGPWHSRRFTRDNAFFYQEIRIDVIA